VAQLPEFNPPAVTMDARRRREMYQAALRRDAARAGNSGTDEEFLRSLELVMRVVPATEEELTRVAELTLRTSQMNATGVHYSDAVLRGLLADPRHDVLVASMTDRFGPHGAVGVVLLSRHAAVWHLKLLATSCRVVSLGAGAVLLRWFVEQSARAGVHLVADFRRTDRNRIMEITYRFAGFGEQPCPCAAAIPATADGIQRLHLAPVRQEPPATMRVVTTTPGEPRPQEWC
jgi:methoxymalonate biosynthesis protein